MQTWSDESGATRIMMRVIPVGSPTPNGHIYTEEVVERIITKDIPKRCTLGTLINKRNSVSPRLPLPHAGLLVERAWVEGGWLWADFRVLRHTDSGGAIQWFLDSFGADENENRFGATPVIRDAEVEEGHVTGGTLRSIDLYLKGEEEIVFDAIEKEKEEENGAIDKPT